MGEAYAEHVAIWQIPNLRAVSWEINTEQWFTTWTCSALKRKWNIRRIKKTGKFSAEDLEEAIYKWGQLEWVRENKAAYLYKLEHVNSKRPCCTLMSKPQIDQSL